MLPLYCVLYLCYHENLLVAQDLQASGAVAQLGARLNRTQEVGGSNPPSSIPKTFSEREIATFPS